MLSRAPSLAHFPCTLAALSAALACVAPAQAAPADQGKGAECAAIDDPTARLACFDAAFPRAPRTPPSSQQPAAAAVAAPAAAAAVAPAAAPAPPVAPTPPAVQAATVAPAAAPSPPVVPMPAVASAPTAPPAPTAAPAAAVAPAVAVAATVAPASEAREFGLTAKQVSEIESKPAPQPLTSVTAAVTTVRKLPSGYVLVNLDNDQVWQQTEIDSNIWLQPGDKVTIRRAAVGSFLLVAPSKYSTRVRRIR